MLLFSSDSRSKRCDGGEDARASVSDQQMRSDNIRYPVDRYLVESSKKFDMANIIDEDIWNPEPALKPEDEIMLRKLHEMLQSTADDLKLLSGELSKYHEPGVQVKMTPTPLDEEFNEKVHIEEVVNAKFHGYKIIEKPSLPVPEHKPKVEVKQEAPITKPLQPKISNYSQSLRKRTINRNFKITPTKIMQISGNADSGKTESLEKLNNGKVVSAPAVAYNEFTYKYEEPETKTPSKTFQVQHMPRINIRSELREQKVLILDIIPNNKIEKPNMISKNIAVVAIQHDMKPEPVTIQSFEPVQRMEINKTSVRKVSKLSTCESSASTIVNSDIQVKSKKQKRPVKNNKSPVKSSTRSDPKKAETTKEPGKPSFLNLNEWRKKLNVVYGTSNAKKNPAKIKSKCRVSPKKLNIPSPNLKKSSVLNNTEYIPYSKLTVGGVRASDIEKEISDIPDKNDIPLSPILDRISGSRENSFSKDSSRKTKQKPSPRVLTTSDENLLQEVIDIEKTVSETLSKELEKKVNEPVLEPLSSDTDKDDNNDCYADDFEEDKSISSKSDNLKSNSTQNDDSMKRNSAMYDQDSDNASSKNEDPSASKLNVHNKTYTKRSTLSFKNSVDIYEFVHSIETQESGTQSNTTQKISPKETQTSPRNENCIQPIHNDLWPTVDPIVEVEKMFKMEKDFIKNLIIEEYGDLLEKNVSKPSTSKEHENRNVVASQKITQTSPAHVKHVMTSPTTTKTRTTSPFAVLTTDHHTSPLIFVTNEDEAKLGIEKEDLNISINLSSPRFSLRLPQNSREVLSNLGDTPVKKDSKSLKNTYSMNTVTSSSSLDADSSEISSLGEVKLKLRRKLRKDRLPSSSDSTSSSSTIHSSDIQSGILPLKSEGELSYGCKKVSKYSKSEGETSFDPL